jgi:hypothetical protein
MVPAGLRFCCKHLEASLEQQQPKVQMGDGQRFMCGYKFCRALTAVQGEHCDNCKVIQEEVSEEAAEGGVEEAAEGALTTKESTSLFSPDTRRRLGLLGEESDECEDESMPLSDVVSGSAASAAPYALNEWQCGIDNCRRPKPCHFHIGGGSAVAAGTGPVVVKAALAQATRRRKFAAFMQEARSAADKMDAVRMGRFNRGEMSEPEGEEATLVHGDVEFPLLVEIDDMECLWIGRSGPGCFIVKFAAVDKEEFTVKCGDDKIRGWSSAVEWLKARPGLFPRILAGLSAV